MPIDERLRAWGRVEVVGPLGEGHRNEVVEVRVDGVRAVARSSTRSPASLAWELDLLDHLTAEGLRVPGTVTTLDGRRSDDGLVVQTFLDGRAPADATDWDLVVAELTRLHEVTVDWPQRPGSRSVAELRPGDRSGDADLSVMPADVVAECREAWAALVELPRSVIHGDAWAANVRMHPDGVGLIDWDEARVDVRVLDLADVPTRPLEEPLATIAGRAAHAWEAANGWTIEPDYARRRLDALRASGPPR